MKIISLQAENVKRLVAIEIRPDGNLVEITGRNGQGKTSVLDSIWWALAGSKHIQAAPIRKGADEARIRLDLGEIVITRRFWKSKSGEDESTIAVESADGARFPSPQKMIDSLLGELSFDPLAFARMEPKDQFNALRRFCPTVDFEAIANADRGDRERRKELNKLAKQELAAAQLITVPTGTPEEEIDEAALTQQLADASDKNAETERRRANRQKVEQDMEAAKAIVASHGARVKQSAEARSAQADAEIERIRAQITQLQGQIQVIEKNCANDISADTQRLIAQCEQAADTAGRLQARLDAAEPLPAPIDAAALQKRLNEARTINANVRKLVEREKHRITAEKLESQAEEITMRIEKRQADKLAAIAAAKMPVEGIGFGDESVLLNGLPFEQGSDAEQLSASVRIAMALNPRLRVIRIRDGSLLDDERMRQLAQMAEENDMQVWIERVDGSGKVGFVLEDGHVRRAEVPAGEAA